MRTYEFECLECDEIIEIDIFELNDVAVCPKCGEEFVVEYDDDEDVMFLDYALVDDEDEDDEE